MALASIRKDIQGAVVKQNKLYSLDLIMKKLRSCVC